MFILTILILSTNQIISNENKIEKCQRTVVDYELCGFAKCFGISVNDLINDYFKKLSK